MNALVVATWFCALAAACSVAALWLVWPRRMSAEEWVLRRRAAAMGSYTRLEAQPAALPWWLQRPILRARAAMGLIQADLRLLQLQGSSAPESIDELITHLGQRAAWGALAGLSLGFGLWLVSGHQGWPAGALALAVLGALLLPALRWLRIRRQASYLRAAIGRRLPRVLTGARVLLESGVSNPEEALLFAVSVYRDPAADVLRQALRGQQVHRIELHDALERVGREYGLEPITRLGDAYRVGSRFGTKMADSMSAFALDARQQAHAAYRERITRAPILMTLPAALFFVLPLLVLILFMVFVPLMGALSQLG